MLNKLLSYNSRLNQFSWNERIFILLYSTFSFLLERLPKNLIRSYEAFRNMAKSGVVTIRKGKNNVVMLKIMESNLKFSIKRDSSDPLVFNQIFVDEEYRPVVDTLTKYGVECKCVLDMGANVGLSTIYLKQWYPDCTIITFEPNQETFKRMQTNLELNKLTNVESINKGVWKRTASLSGSYEFRDHQDWSYRVVEDEAGSIPCIGIEEAVLNSGFDTIDLLKIDIEGGEDALFESLDSVQKWMTEVKVLAIEIHDEFKCRERILNIFDQLDFKHFDTPEGLTIAVNNKLVNSK